MSRFLTESARRITPYVPGEQPRGGILIKLNTNESPFPPPDTVIKAAADASAQTNLYSDPAGTDLRAALAGYLGTEKENVSLGNGSDENLAFIFKAFFDCGVSFPDITYGFYPVLSAFYNIEYTEIPLSEDFSINTADYLGINRNIIIANPNAPTGLLISNSDIEKIAESNPDNIVVIDEAYADFAGQSAVSLTKKHENLIVVSTFSKSRFLAGARLGYTVANADLILDIERVRNAWNPYNVNSMTLAAGTAALRESMYYAERWTEIVKTREWVKNELRRIGFDVTDSQANFVFCRKPDVSGEALYNALRERGFLTRLLSRERIKDWLRITIGTADKMRLLTKALEELQ